MGNIEVVAALIITEGRVFAAQRKAGGETGLKWEFPGGKIELGETRQTALAREIQEELGVRVKVGDYIMTSEYQYQTFSLAMHCFLCTIETGLIQLHEHLDCRWLGADELDSVDWAPADLPVVQWLGRRQNANACKVLGL